MRWSFAVARVSGIDIKVHASFVLILLLGAFEWGMPFGFSGALFGMLVMATLFVCVALHELGHSLVAQRFGVVVREILLLPIGGVARLGSEPKRPVHELLIAVAGPLVNVVIAVALTLGAAVVFGAEWLLGMPMAFMAGPSVSTFVGVLIVANVMLAVFNMIPALPMDGGRVLRALLSIGLGKNRATEMAATVGQVIAAGLGFLGLLAGNLILPLIALFVFIGAGQERTMARTRAMLVGLSVRDACDPHAIVLSPADPLGAVVALALRTPQAHFAVLHGDRVIGTLSRSRLPALVAELGPGAFAAGAMDRELAEVSADLPLPDLPEALGSADGRPLVVRDEHERFVGVVGFEDLSRIAGMAQVLRRPASSRASRPLPRPISR